MTDAEKDEAVKNAQEVSKYAFMLAFALSFPKDAALIAHNRECLKLATDELLRTGMSGELSDDVKGALGRVCLMS